MLYDVTVHIAAGELQEADLDEFSRTLEHAGLNVLGLALEEGPEGGPPWLHVESSVEAQSGYEARRIKGPPLFARALSEAGLQVEEHEIGIVLTRDAGHRIGTTVQESPSA